ncbi:MAG: LON peptidase substrate-binding domain-containing protein, partial [Chloroflexota bacterium]|nr:LON peptidase substrate-binding domain-containing protein [Chloroflexota bacterium]
MSAHTIEIPLFPLHVVLFPGMSLPLHIFEPRYRQMIKDCQREEIPFGVVLARPSSLDMAENPYEYGTLAEIREVAELEDGRFVLMTQGTQRFHILDRRHDKPYLSGLVELYSDDQQPTVALATYAKQAHNLFEQYVEMILEAAHEEHT